MYYNITDGFGQPTYYVASAQSSSSGYQPTAMAVTGAAPTTSGVQQFVVSPVLPSGNSAINHIEDSRSYYKAQIFFAENTAGNTYTVTTQGGLAPLNSLTLTISNDVNIQLTTTNFVMTSTLNQLQTLTLIPHDTFGNLISDPTLLAQLNYIRLRIGATLTDNINNTQVPVNAQGLTLSFTLTSYTSYTFTVLYALSGVAVAQRTIYSAIVNTNGPRLQSAVFSSLYTFDAQFDKATNLGGQTLNTNFA